MLARPIHLMMALLLAAPFLFVVPDARSGELPEGIKVTVIAEYESRVSNLDKVRLVRVLMEPGAVFDKVEIKNEEYCELRKGTLTHTNHETGITNVFTAGDRKSGSAGMPRTDSSAVFFF